MTSDDALPYVGRERALGQLRAVVDRAEGPGIAFAVVFGDAGIGKTRLLHEALASEHDRDQGRAIVHCVGDEYDRERPFAALAPLLELLEKQVTGPARHGQRTGPGRTAAGGAMQRIDEIVDGIVRLARTGVIVVIDDAQWVDDASWRVLRVLGRLDDGDDGDGQTGGQTGRNDARSSVVVAARTPLDASIAGTLDRSLPPTVERIELFGLEEAEVRLLATAGSWPGAPSDPWESLTRRTGGNPLLIEELLRSTAADHPSAAGTTAGESSTPASLRAAVLSRLVGLDGRHRLLLRYAALLGTRFAVTDLAHVTERSVVEVVESLDAAVAVGVIVADGAELRFRHDLVAECFRDDQPPAVRHACHRHIAETLAARGAAASRVAEHYVHAASALEDDRQARDEAADWLERAAVELRPQSLSTAIALLERSVAMTGDDAALRTRHIELATLLLLAGRLEAAEGACQSVLEPGPATTDESIGTHGLLAAIESLRGPARASEAHRHYQRVLIDVAAQLHGPGTSARRAELVAIQAETLAGQSLVTVYTGDIDGAAVLANEAVAVAEAAGNRSALSRAHETLALVAMARSDHERALHHADRAIAWFAPDNGPWAMVVTPHLTAALVAVSAGDLDTAVERCLDGLRITESTDHLLPRLYLLPCLAVFRLIQGDLDEAVRLATLTNDLVDDWCPSHATPVTRALVGYGAHLRGDLDVARSHVDAAAGELGRSGAQLAIADLAAWMVAMVWEVDGRRDDAVGLLRLVWDLIGSATGALVMAPDLVRLYRHLDPVFAEHVVSTLEDRAAKSPGDRTELVRRRAGAILRDDVEELRAVATRYARIGSPLTAAWTLFDAATAAVAVGPADVFERTLRDAVAAFDAVDAPAVSARLRALGRSAGVALRPARKARTTVLTETERRVADLAAQGRTNREIGVALYMSGRTAEAHLGRVFAKLGVRNRVELTATVTAGRLESLDR